MAAPSGSQTYLNKLVEATSRYRRQLLLAIAVLSLVYHTTLFFLTPPYEVSLFIWPVTLGFVLSVSGVWTMLSGKSPEQFYGVAMGVMGIWMGVDLLAGVREQRGVNTWMVLDLMLATLIVLSFIPSRQALWVLVALYGVFLGAALLAGPPDYILLFNMAVLMMFAAYLALHGTTVANERDQKVKLMQELRFDGLTGVLTRQAIEAELLTLLRRGEQALLLMLDLDYFKAVNDTYGHLTGDRVLQSVARALHHEIGERGWVGRWGGEEFMALLRVTSPQEGARLAERLRVCISEVQEAPAGEPLPTMTVSVGGVMLRGLDPEPLIADADTALYAAKGAGRNQVVLAHDSSPVSSGYAAASDSSRSVHQ